MGNIGPKKIKSVSQENVAMPTYTVHNLPQFTTAWNILFSGEAEIWEQIAGQYGMDMYAYDCNDAKCDRDRVCIQYIRVCIKKNKKLLELQRYKKCTLTVPIKDDLNYYLINQYHLMSGAAAQRSDLVLLMLNSIEYVHSKVAFPLVNLQTGSVLGIIDALQKNTTVIHCDITPDLSHTAIVFYLRSEVERKFSYELYLYCNETMEIIKTFTLNHEVLPYVAFDPRYRWSRAAIANYESKEEGIKHELVLFSLDSGKVCKRSNLSLPSLFGGSWFNFLYNLDGSLLILQKLTEDRFGVTSYSDVYIFNSDSLQLIKYVTASLPGLFHICMVNYEPKFSKCGSYMRLLDYKSVNDDHGVTVHIYQLPRQVNLSSQCRITILQNIAAIENICDLPLPNKLKDYLKFLPVWT